MSLAYQFFFFGALTKLTAQIFVIKGRLDEKKSKSPMENKKLCP